MLGKLLPKEEDEVEVVQLVGVVLRCPPAKLRRGRASMVGKERELLHGFGRERERLGEWEGESEQEVLR